MDKPAGVSSHDVVNAVRRATGERRVGHAGTLDPFATGLLVVLVGRATRLAQYVRDEPKRYEARVRFGSETETEDLGGAVTREAPLPSREALEAAALTLVGEIAQVPPAYSAKRIDDKRAYAMARTGEAVVLAPVTVRVHALTFTANPGHAQYAHGLSLERTAQMVAQGRGKRGANITYVDNTLQHMQVLAVHLKDARTWLAKDESRLTEEEKLKLEELMAGNAQLRKMIEMRRDLQAIWSRSNSSREQLVSQLHAWCQRAEESGLASLREFSLRLRRYA